MRLATHCARAVDQGRGCEAPVCATSMGQAARDTTGFRAVRQECGGGSRGTKKCPEQPGRPGCRSGVRFSGCPVRQPPLGLPNPQSLRTNGMHVQHTQALSSIFASNFLSSFPGLAIEERWRGVAPRYALPSPGRSGGGGDARLPSVRDQWGGCAGYDGVPRRAAGVWRRFARNKKRPEQPGRPGRLPGFRLSGCPASVPPLGTPSSVTQDKRHHTACASIVKHQKALISRLKRNGSPTSATARRASV